MNIAFKMQTYIALLLGMIVDCEIAKSSIIECQVLQSYQQKMKLGQAEVVESDIGKLESAESGLGIRSNFSIDLDSGRISGDGMATNSWADTVVVLNPGGAKNDFQEIAISGSGTNTHSMYLEIALYSESRKKPFKLLGYGGPLLAGSCTFQ